MDYEMTGLNILTDESGLIDCAPFISMTRQGQDRADFMGFLQHNTALNVCGLIPSVKIIFTRSLVSGTDSGF